jgi:hypothetical protein
LLPISLPPTLGFWETLIVAFLGALPLSADGRLIGVAARPKC